jgi:hypothetical protein
VNTMFEISNTFQIKVLTIIHNFDIKRDDGTTAAQRLFEKPFPDLFEWLLPPT